MLRKAGCKLMFFGKNTKYGRTGTRHGCILRTLRVQLVTNGRYFGVGGKYRAFKIVNQSFFPFRHRLAHYLLNVVVGPVSR